MTMKFRHEKFLFCGAGSRHVCSFESFTKKRVLFSFRLPSCSNCRYYQMQIGNNLKLQSRSVRVREFRPPGPRSNTNADVLYIKGR